MENMGKNGILILLFVTYLTLSWFYSNITFKGESEHKPKMSSSALKETQSIPKGAINPEKFEITVTPVYTPEEYKSSNVCNDKVLKTINAIDVDYGWKMPRGENCPCSKYILPP